MLDKLNINIKQLIPIAIVGFFLGMFIVVFLFCSPLFDSITKNKKEIKNYSQEITAINKVLQMVAGHQPSVVLADSTKLDDVLDQIIAIGRKNNVIFDFKDTPSNDESVSSNVYQKFLVTLQTRGKYKNIGEFLSEIKDIPSAIVDIDQMLISSDLVDTADITVHLKLAFYFSKEK